MNHSIRRSVISREFQKQLPAAPVMAQFWSRTRMLKQVWSVVEKVSAWPGLIIVRDCNGLCLALGGVTVGYLRWDGRLSLPFGADISQRLLEEEIVQGDPDHRNSKRVIFDVRNLTHADPALA